MTKKERAKLIRLNQDNQKDLDRLDDFIHQLGHSDEDTIITLLGAVYWRMSKAFDLPPVKYEDDDDDLPSV